MKIARFFSVVFGALGAVVMLGSILLCLFALNKPVTLREVPAEAERRCEEMMDALADGDFSTASAIMYGQPDLGVDAAPADEAGAMVWAAFVESISYEFIGECYAKDSGIYWDASVTALSIPTVTENLQTYAHGLLTERVETAEDMTELYDENNNFRQELVSQVLREALEKALREDAQTVTRTVSLKLIQQDGQWWVVPDQALLQTISGGVA